MLRAMVNVTLPEAQHTQAALPHVGILRLVECHAPPLASIIGIELVGVSVPVFAVKLDDQSGGGNEGVNGELAANHVLSDVLDAKTIQNGESGPLQFVGANLLLALIHAAQHGGTFGVKVATFQRAIRDVVAALRTGRRPAKRLAAYLAGVFRLVSTLPFVSTSHGTESRSLSKSAIGHVERRAALSAGDRLAAATLGVRCMAVALQRTVIAARWHPFRDSLATCFTGDGAYRVLVLHTHIVTR